MARVREAMPEDSITNIRKRLRLGDTEHTRRYIEGLRLAGLPE